MPMVGLVAICVFIFRDHFYSAFGITAAIFYRSYPLLDNVDWLSKEHMIQTGPIRRLLALGPG